MTEWLIKGYVSPDCFTGSDTKRLQSALDAACDCDVRKVVIDKPLNCDGAVLLPDDIHVIFAADVAASFIGRGEANFSLTRKNVFLEGQGGVITGDITFFNGEMTVLTGLDVKGNVRFTYCRKVRMENCAVGGTVIIGRGTENSIFQRLKADNIIFTAAGQDGPVPGRGDGLRGIFLRDSELTANGVTLLAADDAGLEYILIDNISAPSAAVTVGDPADPKPAERYAGLSICRLKAPEKLKLHDQLLRAYLDL